MLQTGNESIAVQRREEVARLLATGLLRYRRLLAAATSAPPEFVQNPLDECSPLTAHDNTSAPPVNGGGDVDGDSTYGR